MDDDFVNKFDDDVFDLDEVKGTDLKVQPSFYLHIALLRAQGCLIKDDMNQGFLQFVVLVDHCESLARAMGLLGGDYDEKIKSLDISEDDFTPKGVRIRFAQKRLEFIAQEFFSNKISTKPLRV